MLLPRWHPIGCCTSGGDGGSPPGAAPPRWRGAALARCRAGAVPCWRAGVLACWHKADISGIRLKSRAVSVWLWCFCMGLAAEYGRQSVTEAPIATVNGAWGAGPSPQRWVPVLPRAFGFELGGQRDQRALLAHAAGQHHPDRQTRGGPVQRDAHRGLAGDVVDGGERGEPLLPLEVLRRVHLLEPADRRRRHGQGRGEDRVVSGRRRERAAG